MGKWQIALAVVVAALAAPAQGTQYITGNELQRDCNGSSQLVQGICLGYIQGTVDVLEGVRSEGNRTQCVPTGTELGQVKDVVLDFLTRHPVDRDQSAAKLVAAAVVEAWGCKGR